MSKLTVHKELLSLLLDRLNLLDNNNLDLCKWILPSVFTDCRDDLNQVLTYYSSSRAIITPEIFRALWGAINQSELVILYDEELPPISTKSDLIHQTHQAICQSDWLVEPTCCNRFNITEFRSKLYYPKTSFMGNTYEDDFLMTKLDLKIIVNQLYEVYNQKFTTSLDKQELLCEYILDSYTSLSDQMTISVYCDDEHKHVWYFPGDDVPITETFSKFQGRLLNKSGRIIAESKLYSEKPISYDLMVNKNVFYGSQGPYGSYGSDPEYIFEQVITSSWSPPHYPY